MLLFPSAGAQESFKSAFARFVPSRAILATPAGETGSSISDTEPLGTTCGQFIPSEDGYVSLVMSDDSTVRFWVTKGTVYTMLFKQVKATGTDLTELACFY